MSVEDGIYQALQALVAGSCFRDEARQETPAPYIVFQQVGGSPYDYLEGTPAAQDNGRFQVAAWAADRDSASALLRQARAALVQSTTLRAATVTGLVAAFDPDSGLFGARQDFSIWF